MSHIAITGWSAESLPTNNFTSSTGDQHFGQVNDDDEIDDDHVITSRCILTKLSEKTFEVFVKSKPAVIYFV